MTRSRRPAPDLQTELAAQRLRLVFACGALVMTAALIYASILPLQYQSLAWSVAVDRFWHLPWLRLGIHSRADWVANALMLLPAGWLAAGAVDWKRRSRLPLLLAMPLISLILAAVVIGIEFAQAWFPIRTRSLNDIAMGCAGAFLGPLLWFASGRSVVRGVIELRQTELTTTRLRYGLWLYVLLNFLYAVLPLDVMLSGAEWREKFDAGRLVFTTTSIDITNSENLRGWALAAARAVPIAWGVTLLRGPKFGLAAAILFSAVCELLQIPVFNRTASAWDVAAGSIGGVVGLIGYRLQPKLLDALRRPWVWSALAITGLGLIVATTLARSDHWINDPAEISRRWANAWDWPLAKYYFTSEFAAGTNLLAKLGTFAAVGFCWCGAATVASDRRRPWIYLRASLSVWLAALTIEIGQVYRGPQIPDATDVLVYVVGAGLGYLGFKFINPQRVAMEP